MHHVSFIVCVSTIAIIHVQYTLHRSLSLMLPPPQPPGRVCSPWHNNNPGGIITNALYPHAPPATTTTQESFFRLPCQPHSSGPLFPTITQKVRSSNHPATASCYRRPYNLWPAPRSRCASFADNLVRLLDGDHLILLLGGGDQLLHAVEVEESGTSVIEGESSDFAHLLPIL